MGQHGEYGGPSTVAEELSMKANETREFISQSKILAGCLDNDSKSDALIDYVLVSKLPFLNSRFFLFSLKYPRRALKMIIEADLVHLHFSRELIQIFSGFICILTRKPFITQTHGMIRPKRNLLLFDFFLVRPILRKARVNLVLTNKEEESLKKVEKHLTPFILPNGTFFPIIASQAETNLKTDDKKAFKIVFCSRLHSTKGVQTLIEIAKILKDTEIIIEIYGPDYGQLNSIEKVLNEFLKTNCKFLYNGTIPHNKVREMLKKADLMILPSQYDPYPMIVLESLSVGTPVLISANCGQADIIRTFNPDFVCQTNEAYEYVNKIQSVMQREFSQEDRVNLASLASNKFGIEKVWREASSIYKQILGQSNA